MKPTSLPRLAIKWLVRAAVGAAAGLVLIVLLSAMLSRAKHPSLQAWHTTTLKEEFRAGQPSVKSFEDYLKLEDRLFEELHRRLLDDPAAADPFVLSRYHAGSASSRRAWETPYNR